MLGFCSLFGLCTSILTIRRFTRRQIFIGCQIAFSIIHSIIGTCIYLKFDTGFMIGLFVYIMVYCNTTSSLAWVYAAETTTDAGLGFCLFIMYLCIFILTLVCPYLMQPNILGTACVFFLFAGISFIGSIYYYVFLKETKNLTDREKKDLYQNNFK